MYKSEEKHSQFNLYSTVDNKYCQGTLQRIVPYNLEERKATAEIRNSVRYSNLIQDYSLYKLQGKRAFLCFIIYIHTQGESEDFFTVKTYGNNKYIHSLI